MKLFSYFRSSAAFRVRIALNLKGLAYETVALNLLEAQQKSDEYKRENPQGLVPALKLDSGDVLIQSIAIIEYLEDIHPQPNLLPADPVARAQVRAMAGIIAADIHPLDNLRVLNYLKQPLGHDQDEIDAWYRHWINEGFHALEALVAKQGGRYCHGDQISLADVCLAPQMFNARRFSADLAPFPRLAAIDERLRQDPAFAAAMPQNQPDAPQQ